MKRSCVVKRGRRKTVALESAVKYFTVARALRNSAQDVAELATEDDSYGNALALIIIHSAIAYTDALTIAFGNIKSSEGDHLRTVDTMKTALGNRTDSDALRNLTAILGEKDKVAYQGIYYSVEHAKRLMKKFVAFADWAETTYDLRPVKSARSARNTRSGR